MTDVVEPDDNPKMVTVSLEKTLEQRKNEIKAKFRKAKIFTRLELEELGENVEDILFDDLKPDTMAKYKMASEGQFENFFKKNRNKNLFECISEISSDDFNMEFLRKNKLGHKDKKTRQHENHYGNMRRHSTSRISSYQGSRIDFWKENKQKQDLLTEMIF